jgi:hypothetical protein
MDTLRRWLGAGQVVRMTLQPCTCAWSISAAGSVNGMGGSASAWRCVIPARPGGSPSPPHPSRAIRARTSATWVHRLIAACLP